MTQPHERTLLHVRTQPHARTQSYARRLVLPEITYTVPALAEPINKKSVTQKLHCRPYPVLLLLWRLEDPSQLRELGLLDLVMGKCVG